MRGNTNDVNAGIHVPVPVLGVILKLSIGVAITVMNVNIGWIMIVDVIELNL